MCVSLHELDWQQGFSPVSLLDKRERAHLVAQFFRVTVSMHACSGAGYTPNAISRSLLRDYSRHVTRENY